MAHDCNRREPAMLRARSPPARSSRCCSPAAAAAPRRSRTRHHAGGTPAAYSGPAPATADVQAFKLNVWDNLKADEPLRPVPRAGRPGAAVRAPGRHQPRLRGRQHRRESRLAARFADGRQGGRRPQLLAREPGCLRATSSRPGSPHWAGRDRRRRHAGRRAQGAADQGRRREQELPRGARRCSRRRCTRC